MMTFSEFVFETELKDDFPNMTDDQVRQYIIRILSINRHAGNCQRENVSCVLCELTDLLNNYWDYTKEQGQLKNK